MMKVPVYYIGQYYPFTGNTSGGTQIPATKDYPVYDRRHSSQEVIAWFKRVEDAEAFCEHMNAVLSLRNAA